MNPYVYEVSCEVCGGTGMARPCDAAAAWTTGVHHSNPEVCAMYLEEKARKLAEREKALAEKS